MMRDLVVHMSDFVLLQLFQQEKLSLEAILEETTKIKLCYSIKSFIGAGKTLELTSLKQRFPSRNT
jgi:hypothetical protein